MPAFASLSIYKHFSDFRLCNENLCIEFCCYEKIAKLHSLLYSYILSFVEMIDKIFIKFSTVMKMIICINNMFVFLSFQLIQQKSSKLEDYVLIALSNN